MMTIFLIYARKLRLKSYHFNRIILFDNNCYSYILVRTNEKYAILYPYVSSFFYYNVFFRSVVINAFCKFYIIIIFAENARIEKLKTPFFIYIYNVRNVASSRTSFIIIYENKRYIVIIRIFLSRGIISKNDITIIIII